MSNRREDFRLVRGIPPYFRCSVFSRSQVDSVVLRHSLLHVQLVTKVRQVSCQSKLSLIESYWLVRESVELSQTRTHDLNKSKANQTLGWKICCFHTTDYCWLWVDLCTSSLSWSPSRPLPIRFPQTWLAGGLAKLAGRLCVRGMHACTNCVRPQTRSLKSRSSTCGGTYGSIRKLQAVSCRRNAGRHRWSLSGPIATE